MSAQLRSLIARSFRRRAARAPFRNFDLVALGLFLIPWVCFEWFDMGSSTFELHVRSSAFALFVGWSALAGYFAFRTPSPSFDETLPRPGPWLALDRLTCAVLPTLLAGCAWAKSFPDLLHPLLYPLGGLCLAVLGMCGAARALGRRDTTAIVLLVVALYVQAGTAGLVSAMWQIELGRWYIFQVLLPCGLVSTTLALAVSASPRRTRIEGVVVATALVVMGAIVSIASRSQLNEPEARSLKIRRTGAGRAVVVADTVTGQPTTWVDAASGQCRELGRSRNEFPGQFVRIEHHPDSLFPSPRIVDTRTGEDADVSSLVGDYAPQVVSLSSTELGSRTSSSAWTAAALEGPYVTRLGGFRQGRLRFEAPDLYSVLQDGESLVALAGNKVADGRGAAALPRNFGDHSSDWARYIIDSIKDGVWVRDRVSLTRTQLLGLEQLRCDDSREKACQLMGRALPGRRSLLGSYQRFRFGRSHSGEHVYWLRALDVGDRRKLDLLRFAPERGDWVPVAVDLFEGSIFRQLHVRLAALGSEHAMRIDFLNKSTLVVDLDSGAVRPYREQLVWSPSHTRVLAFDRAAPQLGRSELTLTPTSIGPRLPEWAPKPVWVDDEHVVAVDSQGIWILEASTGSWRRCETRRD
ncbi:MAG: hypothetical protein HY791_34890 [Deltaproteobacteria bacterium]|nr:hypothetical protein [Deltaproteobacteria bacterium]